MNAPVRPSVVSTSLHCSGPSVGTGAPFYGFDCLF
jgi:hypothetical protein